MVGITSPFCARDLGEKSRSGIKILMVVKILLAKDSVKNSIMHNKKYIDNRSDILFLKHNNIGNPRMMKNWKLEDVEYCTTIKFVIKAVNPETK